MKKRNITLCAVAMLCMQGYAKADTFTLKGDNTCVENYAQMTAAYKSNRPKMKKRLFTSKAVEAEILRVKKLLTNPKLEWMFENCFPNTLDTTVHFRMLDGKPDTFVYTGDIHAMWLRDSGAQVWPYVHGESGISFLPAKVAPCPGKPGKAALRAGCREIIILAALAVFFHGKPCGIPDRGGKAFRK